MVQNKLLVNSHIPKNFFGMTGKDDCKSAQRWWDGCALSLSCTGQQSTLLCTVGCLLQSGVVRELNAVYPLSPTMYFSLKRPIPLVIPTIF